MRKHWFDRLELLYLLSVRLRYLLLTFNKSYYFCTQQCIKESLIFAAENFTESMLVHSNYLCKILSVELAKCYCDLNSCPSHLFRDVPLCRT